MQHLEETNSHNGNYVLDEGISGVYIVAVIIIEIYVCSSNITSLQEQLLDNVYFITIYGLWNFNNSPIMRQERDILKLIMPKLIKN